jgi:hypothetical protein
MHAKASVIAKHETRQALKGQAADAGKAPWLTCLEGDFMFCRARFLRHEFCHEANLDIIVRAT